MGVLTALKLLVSAPKAIDIGGNIIKSVTEGIDHLKFTEEEASEAKIKGFDQLIEFVKLNRDENSQRSITRRSIAVMLVRYFLLVFTFYLGTLVYLPHLSDNVFSALKLYFPLVTGVCFFYFGYYGVKSIVQSLVKK